MKIHFFKHPGDMQQWFESRQAEIKELHVGYFRKVTGRESITWEESVEVAICWGWIDGIRHSVDESSYTIRFTPRKKNSTWSRKNIDTAQKLITEKKMKTNGMEAFKNRKAENSGIYSFEKNRRQLDRCYEKVMKEHKDAWAFFSSQPPGYRKIVAHWVMSAKQEVTRMKRLNQLITDSANGMKIKPLRRSGE
jgi:uncharacterized protein YdeI (YjbR/CyaY-like superfamily)